MNILMNVIIAEEKLTKYLLVLLPKDDIAFPAPVRYSKATSLRYS